LPVVLLLGAVLAAGALTIGTACLDQARRMGECQRATDGFNRLVERVRILSAGGVGSVQLLELDLGGYSISVDGEHVQLTAGGSTLQSEVLPVPLLADGNEIRSGTYIVRLERGDHGELVSRIRGV